MSPPAMTRSPGRTSTQGFIVAGGRSSRIGRDKALLPYRESTLLEHAMGVARSVTPDVHILCGPAPRYEDLRAPILTDIVCGAGPLGGLYAALLSASVEGRARMFWLAVDLPLVPPEFLRRLVTELDRAEVAMARTARGAEPLCAAFRTEPTLGAIRRALLEGRLKLTQAMDGLLIQHVDADADTFVNVNTSGDYDQLARRKTIDE